MTPGAVLGRRPNLTPEEGMASEAGRKLSEALAALLDAAEQDGKPKAFLVEAKYGEGWETMSSHAELYLAQRDYSLRRVSTSRPLRVVGVYDEGSGQLDQKLCKGHRR
jgi:hypothetical protein